MTTPADRPNFYEYALNGESLRMSKLAEVRITRRESFTETASGRKRTHRVYDGAGLPDVLDSMEFALEWDLTDEQSDTIVQLEKARAGAGPHRFIVWKRRYARYTAAAGQTVIYLPRPDAYNEGIAGHTAAADQAVVTVNGIAVPVTYTTVTSGTAVDTGEVWISSTSTTHPDTGATVTLAKFGDELAANDDVLVEYCPVFLTQISDASDSFDLVEREDKSIVLVESDN
jgi:hypothetical protein